MKQLIHDLHTTKLLRVTGSYADGSQTKSSDIDFYVKPDKPDTPYEQRNIQKIINILNKHGIKWNSTVTGYIFTHKSPNNLHIQLEFSDLYDKRPDKKPNVTIEGYEFKTW